MAQNTMDIPPATAPTSLDITSAPIFPTPPRIPVVLPAEAASTLATAAVLAAFAAMLPIASEDDAVELTVASAAVWRMSGDSSLIVCRIRVAAIRCGGEVEGLTRNGWRRWA